MNWNTDLYPETGVHTQVIVLLVTDVRCITVANKCSKLKRYNSLFIDHLPHQYFLTGTPELTAYD